MDSIPIDPMLGSSSPPSIFMDVAFPQAFAPITPQRFPPPNFTDTSEKRGIAPNCMAMPEATITEWVP